MAQSPIEVLLARRPQNPQADAFGHVDVSAAGRDRLQDIADFVVDDFTGRKEIPFHPDDEAQPGEVLTAKLNGFDSWFQQQAPWSMERAVAEIRKPALPSTLNADGVRRGGWTFYAVRATVAGSDVVIVRAKSPTYGLGGANKIVTAFVGTQLKPIDDPLIAFDRAADAVVIDNKVFVLRPRSVERLLVDADAVKARAGETAIGFESKLGARLSAGTTDAVQRVCSKNANVARRVERLNRDGALSRVTAARVRAALPDANLHVNDFGRSGPLRADTDAHAVILIDIAADLFYQPRFADAPRRVAIYRNLR